MAAHEKTYRPATWLILLVFASCLVVNYGFAQSTFQNSSDAQAERRPQSEYLRLPSPATLRALFLGFDTMAADAAWILTIVHYGPRDATDPGPKYLLENTHTIADLDPRFYDVYEWGSGAYVHLRRAREIDFGSIARLNEFLQRGIEAFPDEYWLPYDAAMNWVGYPRYDGPRQKLNGYERAIEQMQRAAAVEDAPDHLPLAVKWLYSERQKLRAEIEGEEETAARAPSAGYFAFLSRMYYLVDDEKVRESIESELKQTRAGQRALGKLERKYGRQLQRARARSFGYLPVDLWSLVAAETHDRSSKAKGRRQRAK